MFVLIVPGSINTIFIPNGLSSYAIDSLNASIANLVLEYAEIPGKLMRPVIALMLTITLLPLLLFFYYYYYYRSFDFSYKAKLLVILVSFQTDYFQIVPLSLQWKDLRHIQLAHTPHC